MADCTCHLGPMPYCPVHGHTPFGGVEEEQPSWWRGPAMVEGQIGYHPRDPRLLFKRLAHRLLGRRRGCSCSRCYWHPRRRLPASEVYEHRVRLAKLEERVRMLGRDVGNLERAVGRSRREQAERDPDWAVP